MLIKPEEISSIIKKKIDNYETQMQIDEVGYVIQSSDGIAKIYGLENCMAGELIDFGNGIFGMAQNLEEECVGCVLLGGETEIKEGSVAKRTGKSVSIGVSDDIIGRVINPLGQPLDGLEPYKIDSYRDINSLMLNSLSINYFHSFLAL